MTSRKTSTQRGIDEVLHRLEEGDTLIVTELSRLGRTTAEIIALVNDLVQRGIRLFALKQNIDLSSSQHDMSSKIIVTVFSLLAELERDFISMRTIATYSRGGVKVAITSRQVADMNTLSIVGCTSSLFEKYSRKTRP